MTSQVVASAGRLTDWLRTYIFRASSRYAIRLFIGSLISLSYLTFIFVYLIILIMTFDNVPPILWIPALLIFLLIIWIFPHYFFGTREFEVLVAVFSFGSDLNNPDNPNVLATHGTHVTGSEIAKFKEASMVAPEAQFQKDWANAIRRGMRELYQGVLDHFYLQEANDLYEVEFYRSDPRPHDGGRVGRSGYGMRAGMPPLRRLQDVRGKHEIPWGGDEDDGTYYDGSQVW